jgi:hypothetical protein
MTTTPPTTDALSMDRATYKAEKRKIVEAGYKVAKTPPAPVFDKARLTAEIEAFQASGLQSPMTDTASNTSNVSPTPQRKITRDSRSAHELSASEYEAAKRDIRAGKPLPLPASDSPQV